MPDACRLKPVLLTELDSVSKPHYRRSVLNVLYNLTLLAGLVLVDRKSVV